MTSQRHSLAHMAHSISSPVPLSYHPSDHEPISRHSACWYMQSVSLAISVIVHRSYHPLAPLAMEHTG